MFVIVLLPTLNSGPENPEISAHGTGTLPLPLLDDGTLMRFRFNSDPAGVTSSESSPERHQVAAAAAPEEESSIDTRSRGRQVLGM